MKKFDIIKAIHHNDQLILCESGFGFTVRFMKINFVKQTPTKQMVFTTKDGARVVLKADKFDVNKFDVREYNPCGKYSNCWVATMSDAENSKHFDFVECGSVAF
jgi:hypothetical protein